MNHHPTLSFRTSPRRGFRNRWSAAVTAARLRRNRAAAIFVALATLGPAVIAGVFKILSTY